MTTYEMILDCTTRLKKAQRMYLLERGWKIGKKYCQHPDMTPRYRVFMDEAVFLQNKKEKEERGKA